MVSRPVFQGAINPRGQSAESATLRKIAILGSYSPRQCGIATFTTDLAEAIATNGTHVEAIAVEDEPGTYSYDARVTRTLDQNRESEYRNLAFWINSRGFDALCVQHEFGIYGGPAGMFLGSLLRMVTCPIITTLHTLLVDPSPQQRKALADVIAHSAQLVVMSRKAASILESVYDVAPGKISIVPHGIPSVGPKHENLAKEELGLVGRRLLLTFGLLSPDKGIEDVIKALPAVVKKYPETLYRVVGATHPHIRASVGEQYRESLVKLASDLGVSKQVEFENRFVSIDELTQRLQAADIYVTPYRKKEQITSGTLAYAFGCGNAVVSTPYWHAEELLADGMGILVPQGDIEAISKAFLGLFGDDEKLIKMQRNAYRAGMHMQWPEIGYMYRQVFTTACREQVSSSLRSPRTTDSRAPMNL